MTKRTKLTSAEDGSHIWKGVGDVKKNMYHILQLPEDVIYCILQHLDEMSRRTMAMTCRQWRVGIHQRIWPIRAWRPIPVRMESEFDMIQFMKKMSPHWEQFIRPQLSLRVTDPNFMQWRKTHQSHTIIHTLYLDMPAGLTTFVEKQADIFRKLTTLCLHRTVIFHSSMMETLAYIPNLLFEWCSFFVDLIVLQCQGRIQSLLLHQCTSIIHDHQNRKAWLPIVPVLQYDATQFQLVRMDVNTNSTRQRLQQVWVTTSQVGQLDPQLTTVEHKVCLSDNTVTVGSQLSKYECREMEIHCSARLPTFNPLTQIVQCLTLTTLVAVNACLSLHRLPELTHLKLYNSTLVNQAILFAQLQSIEIIWNDGNNGPRRRPVFFQSLPLLQTLRLDMKYYEVQVSHNPILSQFVISPFTNVQRVACNPLLSSIQITQSHGYNTCLTQLKARGSQIDVQKINIVDRNDFFRRHLPTHPLLYRYLKE